MIEKIRQWSMRNAHTAQASIVRDASMDWIQDRVRRPKRHEPDATDLWGRAANGFQIVAVLLFLKAIAMLVVLINQMNP